MRVLSKSYTLACAASLLAAVAAGCLPTVYNKRPEVKGTVRDLTGAPVAGATVRVTDPARPDGAGGASARSDAQGRFKVPPARQLGLYWFAGRAQREWTWQVDAEAPGHTPASVDLSHRGRMPKQTFDNLQFRLPAQ
jgi:hypothetical protein